MTKRFFLLLPAFIGLLAACGPQGPVAYPNPAPASLNPTPATPPVSCQVTLPPSPAFVPPAPAPATPPSEYAGQYWYGSPDLWTMLPIDGTWRHLQLGSGGLSQSLFWWSQGYSASAEAKPALSVAASRLDGPATPVLASNATKASADFGEAMLIDLTLPSAGCWAITGQYKGHNLSFVVWATP